MTPRDECSSVLAASLGRRRARRRASARISSTPPTPPCTPAPTSRAPPNSAPSAPPRTRTPRPRRAKARCFHDERSCRVRRRPSSAATIRDPINLRRLSHALPSARVRRSRSLSGSHGTDYGASHGPSPALRLSLLRLSLGFTRRLIPAGSGRSRIFQAMRVAMLIIEQLRVTPMAVGTMLPSTTLSSRSSHARPSGRPPIGRGRPPCASAERVL